MRATVMLGRGSYVAVMLLGLVTPPAGTTGREATVPGPTDHPPRAIGLAPRSSDFNGDGVADLPIGVMEGPQGVLWSGSVQVLYGTADGLQAQLPDDQLWTQDSPGVPGVRTVAARFGTRLSPGDFNGDGYADLAIGMQDEGSLPDDAGAVVVLYGSSGGLQAEDPSAQLWSQDSPGLRDQAEEQDFFNEVEAGDFDGDGYTDLAIGAPLDDLDDLSNAGSVTVLYGSTSGLQTHQPEDQFWTQDRPGVGGVAEKDDWFGTALASGDLNGDGFGDLAIGTRFDKVDGIQAGTVNILYGGPLGLQASAPADQLWSQDSPGVQEHAEDGEVFGWDLAIGDMNADGYEDLGMGTFDEALDAPNVGVVQVLYGSAEGLQANAPDDQLWSQDSHGVEGRAQAGDFFGHSLFCGDFNGDGVADLAIGVIAENVDGRKSAGAVNILYGSPEGLQAPDPADQLWTQNSPDVSEVAEYNDRMPSSLFAADLNADGRDDLAIGVIEEDIGDHFETRVVAVLYGGMAGLQSTAPDDQLWTQDSPGVKGLGEGGDQFGTALG
jgi:hypothetical protein